MEEANINEERAAISPTVNVGPDGIPIVLPEGGETTVEEHDPEANVVYDKFAEPGRVRRFNTILNLMNSLLGAGILGIPGSMQYCGIIPSMLLLILIAVLSHVGTVMVIRLQDRTKATGLDELASIVLGKFGSVFLSIMSMCFCISCMVAYTVIGPDSLMSFLRLGGINIGNGWPRAGLVLLYAICIPAAMTLPRQVSFLSMFSWVNFFCIIFFVVVMLLKGIILLPKQGISDDVVVFDMGIGFFNAMSIFGLAFALPVVVLPIIGPYNKDIRKRGVASFWSLFLCLICVAIPGIFGYLLQGKGAKDNVLLSFPDDDVPILLCRIGFFLVVSFSYPCIAQSMLCSWSQLIFGQNNQSELPTRKRAVVLGISNVIPIVIAMALPNAGPALSVGGALGGCLVDFFFPALMWFVLSRKRWYHWQNILCILFGLFGIVSAVISTYLAVVAAI